MSTSDDDLAKFAAELSELAATINNEPSVEQLTAADERVGVLLPKVIKAGIVEQNAICLWSMLQREIAETHAAISVLEAGADDPDEQRIYVKVCLENVRVLAIAWHAVRHGRRWCRRPGSGKRLSMRVRRSPWRKNSAPLRRQQMPPTGCMQSSSRL